MRGPTINTFPHEPNPADDAALWVQGKDGMNMNTTVADFKGIAAAAAPPLDLSRLIAILTDSGGNGLAAQVLAALVAGVVVRPGSTPLSVVLPAGALPLPVTLQGASTFTYAGTQTVNIGAVNAPIPTIGMGASAAARGTLYAATAGPQALAVAAAPVALLANPPGSGRTLYLDSFLFTSGVDAYLTRGRLAAVPTSGLGTAVPVAVNTLGAASTPVGKLYLGPTAAAVAGQVVEWASHAKAGTPLNFAVDGRIAIPAGTAAVWSAQGLGSLLGLSGLLVQGAVSPQWWEG